MTDKQRKKAAVMLKELLFDGMLRKNAIRHVCAEFSIGRSALYKYIKRFNINVK